MALGIDRNRTGVAGIKFCEKEETDKNCLWGGSFLSVAVWLSGNNKFADRISHRGKLLLIFSHDISLIQCFIMVQIPGEGIQMPACRFHLLQRKLKQIFVIGLKFYMTFRFQDLIISAEVSRGSQTSFRMSVFWATDRKKVQINAGLLHVQRTYCRYFQHPYEQNAGFPAVSPVHLFFQSTDKHAGIFFNTDIVDFRILLCQCCDKLAFSPYLLQWDRMIISKNCMPVSGLRIFLENTQWMLGDSLPEPGTFLNLI